MFTCPSGLSMIGIYIAVIILLGFLFRYILMPLLPADKVLALGGYVEPGLALLTAVLALAFIDSQTTHYWCEKEQ